MCKLHPLHAILITLIGAVQAVMAVLDNLQELLHLVNHLHVVRCHQVQQDQLNLYKIVCKGYFVLKLCQNYPLLGVLFHGKVKENDDLIP